MRVNLTQAPYVLDLLDQPEALRRTWERLPESAELAGFSAALRSGRFRRIVLTGMGSSYHALYPLQLTLLQAGFGAQLLETSELIHFVRELLTPDTLVVAVSQSGRSAETMALLDLAGADVPIIAVTNDAESPLARRARVALLMHAGAEASVSCKTYVASLLALDWLAAIFTARDLGATREALADAAPAAASYLANWTEHICELRPQLAAVRQVFVVGRGPSLATAGTGGLILKEAARFAAEGMSSAAFRHGPLESVNGGVLVVVLAGAGAPAELNRKLAADIRSAGGRAAVVDGGDARGVFAIPAPVPTVRTILEIMPVQMISLALAEKNGHEPGRFELATKITATE